MRCIRPDAPERKDSYVCDCDLSRANQVTDMGFESMARTSEVRVEYILRLVTEEIVVP